MSACAEGPGNSPDTLLDDTVRPGRGMGLVVDIVKQSVKSISIDIVNQSGESIREEVKQMRCMVSHAPPLAVTDTREQIQDQAFGSALFLARRTTLRTYAHIDCRMA